MAGKLELPSRTYIRQELYDKYAVPPNIIRHCEKVTDVSMVLGRGLKNVGVDINLDLLERLSMVHDSMKAVSLPPLVPNPDLEYTPTDREISVQSRMKEKYEGMHETLIAADVLRPEFPEFSEYVANIGSTGNPTYLNGGIELKVSHYADWRVQLDQIVPFGDRLNYLQRTYLIKQPDKGDEWWQAAVRDERALEHEIFDHLPFQPDDLAQVMVEGEQVEVYKKSD